MKTIPYRIGLILLCLIFVFPFYGVKCTDNDEPEEPDMCGQVQTKTIEWSYDYLQPEENFVYVEEGFYVYDYSPAVTEDVCAYRHVAGTVRIGMHHLYIQEVLYEAEVVYGVLFTYPILEWDSEAYGSDHIQYKGTFEFGMKHVYGDEPGWFLPVIRIFVWDQGTAEDTHEVLRTAIDYINLVYTYYEWQDNSKLYVDF